MSVALTGRQDEVMDMIRSCIAEHGYPPTSAERIAHYVAGVIRDKDGRGRTRNTMECYRALLPGTTPTIAMLTAQAVRDVGEAIARKAAA